MGDLMNISKEHEREFARFPAILRELVLAELAAGNEIVEFSHGFPAAPCGAYIKLARQVTTRPRLKTPELDFHERHSPIHSGEFTDENRHFFVLEPPNSPPAEADMDAIRKAHDPKPGPLERIAQRETESSHNLEIDASSVRPTPEPMIALTNNETATGWSRELNFVDSRPPHEVRFALERELMTLFAVAMDDGKLCMLAKAIVNGARYFFELRFEAALLLQKFYSLRIEVSWVEQPEKLHNYFRKTSDSWYHFWTRDLMATSPPEANMGRGDAYRTLCEESLRAETQLDSVAAVQRAIVEGVKRGGRFVTSHKEGGTNIYWRDGKFIRSDFGDCPALVEYHDETEFLKMLRQFCQFDVMRNNSREPPSEFDVWKLILRRLNSN